MRINDLLYLIKENVNATFNDILSSFLIDNKILFSPNVEIVGKKWYILSFRLFNPLTSRQGSPARPNDVNQAKVFKFDVRETSNTRDSKYVLLLNDSNTAIRDQMKMNALVGLDDNLAEVIGFEKIQNDPSLLVAT